MERNTQKKGKTLEIKVIRKQKGKVMEDSRVHLTKEKHSVSHQGRHLTEDTDTKLKEIKET